MSDFGTVVEVYIDTLGDELAADAGIGAATLTVVDPADFSEDGGTLQVGTEVLVYSVCDDETGIITLTGVTAAAHVTGDTVYRYPIGQEKRAMVALADDSEAIDCLVPQALWDNLTEGIRAGTGEQVIVEESAPESWAIADILGAVPLQYGTVYDPGTATSVSGSDGAAPAASAIPTVVGLPRLLLAKIPGVVNHDAVTYEWHISTGTTTPTFGDATTHHRDASTLTTFANLADGVTLLDYATTYYVGVFAYDVDQPTAGASAFSGWSTGAMLNPNGTADIAVGAILAANIDVVDLLASGIRTADAGQRVAISTADGITVYDSAENLRASFPTTGSDFKINADVDAQTLTVEDALTLRGLTNVFAKQSVVTLESSIQASQSPATVAVGWPAVALATDAFTPTDNRRGLFYYSAQWWMGHRFAGAGFLQSYNPSTGAVGTGGGWSLPTGYQPDGGIVHTTISAANRWVILCKNSVNAWMVTITDDAGVFQSAWAWTTGNTGRDAAITVDGAGNVVLAQRASSNVYTVELRDVSTGTLTSTANVTASIGSPTSSAVTGVNWGAADFGSTRVAIGLREDQRVRTFNPLTGTEYANNSFTTANGENVGGLAWDGTNFYTSSRDTSALYKYSNIFATAAESTAGVAYTWEDTDATGGTHETTMSVQTAKTVHRRQSVTVTTPNIPDSGGTDDPDSTNIYIGYGTVPLARTSMFLHASPASGVKTAVISVQSAATNPPAANNFPAATPAKVVDTAGNTLLSGDSSWTAYTPAWTATGTAPAIGNGTITGAYTRIGKTVTGRITMTLGSTSTVGTGSYRWSLPVTANNASDFTVGTAKFLDSSAGSNKYSVGADLLTTTTLSLFQGGSAGGAVSASSPVVPANGDVYNIFFTYEAA